MLPALDVAGVFPRWYPEKWLTEDDNPQNNKMEAWERGLPWSARHSSWSKQWLKTGTSLAANQIIETPFQVLWSEEFTENSYYGLLCFYLKSLQTFFV